jgi:ADP-L-glycero-D-manno-heptose 6-epimerase
MRILITGYKGFIGKNMVEALAPHHDLVLYTWGDSVLDLDGVDQVIHLGAISSTMYKDVRQIMKQNYAYTAKLVGMCVRKNIPIQIASSASVYGPNNTTFDENDPPDPRTPYAWTKYLAEYYCESLASSSPIQLFRYFNVYGKYEDHKGDQASPYHRFRKQKEETGTITLYEGSDKFYRDFVPVERIVEVQTRFFNIRESGVWNIGTGKAKSFYDVALEVGGEIKWVPFPKNFTHAYQTFTCANLGKLRRTLFEGH